MPIYYERCRKLRYTVLYSFELSLVVEILQLVFKVGSLDVDDLILNTIGGLFGFLVYELVKQFIRKTTERKSMMIKKVMIKFPGKCRLLLLSQYLRQFQARH